MFPTTCAATVQARFEAGVAMLHSFWFEEALRAFDEVAAQDPACAMAYWGRPLTLLGNPMTRLSPPPEHLAAALAAAEQAGDRDHARRYYAELIELMADADAAREEPQRARAFLARR